jgi:hypothetical protein
MVLTRQVESIESARAIPDELIMITPHQCGRMLECTIVLLFRLFFSSFILFFFDYFVSFFCFVRCLFVTACF